MSKKRKGITPSRAPFRGEIIAPHDVAREGSTNALRPEFNLEYLGGDYCLSRCTREEKAAFADRLHELGRMTWQDIQLAARHGQGSEIIPRKAIGGRRVPDEVTPDVKLLAFRFYGKAPLVGFRRGRTLVILLLDRDFTLYEHG